MSHRQNVSIKLWLWAAILALCGSTYTWAMQPNPLNIAFDSPPNALLGWLPVPGTNDSVRIKVNPSKSVPDNFVYVDSLGNMLPKGLYWWKADIKDTNIFEIIFPSGIKSGIKFIKKGNWFYSKKDEKDSFNPKKYVHPSSIYQLILSAKASVPGAVAGGQVNAPAFNPNDLNADVITFGSPSGKEVPPAYDENNTYLRKDFFKNIMGMYEKAFIEEIKSKQNPQIPNKYAHGEFSLKKISTLNPQAKGGGKFHVIEGVSPENDSWFKKYIEVAALQAAHGNTADSDVAFQLASNFHCLEGHSNPKKAQAGLLEESVSKDKYTFYFTPPPGTPNDMIGGLEETRNKAVQGEEASISAAPGLIYKMYYSTPVNLLEGIKAWAPIDEVGKVNLKDNTWKEPEKSYTNILKDRTLTQNFINLLSVGYLKKVEVTGGMSNVLKGVDRSMNRNAKVIGQPRFIDQIFTSALDLHGRTYQRRSVLSARGYDPKDNEMQALAQLILMAMYEGTIKAAWSEGKQTLYLTLVGGGDFQNSLYWLGSAIKRCEQWILDSGMNVYLIFYDINPSRNDPRNNQEYKAFQANMYEMVEKTGGTYTRYSKEGKRVAQGWNPTYRQPTPKKVSIQQPVAVSNDLIGRYFYNDIYNRFAVEVFKEKDSYRADISMYYQKFFGNPPIWGLVGRIFYFNNPVGDTVGFVQSLHFYNYWIKKIGEDYLWGNEAGTIFFDKEDAKRSVFLAAFRDMFLSFKDVTDLLKQGKDPHFLPWYADVKFHQFDFEGSRWNSVLTSDGNGQYEIDLYGDDGSYFGKISYGGTPEFFDIRYSIVGNIYLNTYNHSNPNDPNNVKDQVIWGKNFENLKDYTSSLFLRKSSPTGADSFRRVGTDQQDYIVRILWNLMHIYLFRNNPADLGIQNFGPLKPNPIYLPAMHDSLTTRLKDLLNNWEYINDNLGPNASGDRFNNAFDSIHGQNVKNKLNAIKYNAEEQAFADAAGICAQRMIAVAPLVISKKRSVEQIFKDYFEPLITKSNPSSELTTKLNALKDALGSLREALEKLSKKLIDLSGALSKKKT